jgi:uncharacterized protein
MPSIKTSGLAICSFVAFLMYFCNANAASFDCAKASAPQEKAVCANPTLSALDDKLAESYKNARAVSQDPAKLKSEQIEWIKEVRKCAVETSCIERLYSLRISELNPQPVKPTMAPVVSASPIDASAPAVELQVSATQSSASAIAEAPAATVESAVVPLPAPVASEAKTVNVEPNPSIFSDPSYQRYALIAIGSILALIAAYFLFKYLISLAKRTASKASSATRAAVAKLSEEADSLKEGMSNKAQDISSQAKARASVLATDFNKEGGMKDQIKSMSQKTLDVATKAGAELKQEVENINNIRIATLQEGNAAANKADLLKSFWSQLSQKQKIIIISISLILIFLISNLTESGKSSGGESNKSSGDAVAEFRDPKIVANNLQISGVSRCIAAVIIMSAGLAKDSSIQLNGPEIRNNNNLLDFYGKARLHLINSMNNPAAEAAIDGMVRQQSEYFGNIVRFQGWDAFLPTYKECAVSAYR